MNPCEKDERELRKAFDIWIKAENGAKNLGGDVDYLERTQISQEAADRAAAAARATLEEAQEYWIICINSGHSAAGVKIVEETEGEEE